jgi:hypothetical protein
MGPEIEPHMSHSRDRAARWTRVLMLFAAALLEAAGRIASAQDVDPRTTARLRLGPVYVAPTFELRDIGVDTNVYNESDDGILEPTTDFYLTAVPTFVATVGPPATRLTVRSVTSFVYFAQQVSERYVDQEVVLSAQGTFGRITPFGDYAFLNTRDRVSFEVDARARRIEQRAVGGVRVTITPKISADVHGEVWQNDFDEDEVEGTFGLAAELNRQTRALGAGIAYRLTPLTRVTVVGDVSKIRFSEAKFRDSDVQQMLFGVELNPRALIGGSARLGYQRFRPLDSRIPDFTGLIGNGAVSYRLRPQTSIVFSFDRRTDFSYLVVEPYYVHQEYGLSLSRQLAPQWDLALSANRTSHNYLRLLQSPGDSREGHRETVTSGGVTLGYDVGPRLRTTVALLYQDRYSDFVNRSYNAFRVGASMIYRF